MDRKLHSIPIFSSSVFITLSFQQIYYCLMIITLKFTKQKKLQQKTNKNPSEGIYIFD